MLVLAACGSSAKVSTGPTTTTSVHTTPAPGLRGIPVRAFACPPPADSPAVSPRHIADVDVEAFLLCPLGMPGQTARAVTVAAGGVAFDGLVSALSQPDTPKPPGDTVCAAYADLIQHVLAKTSRGAFQVSIPVDSCGHYLRAALDALDHARNG